jgi:hypothetical protein
MRFDEQQLVILTTDLPDQRLKAGDIGTVVLVHGQDAGYEVEFMALNGETLAVVSVHADQVRRVGRNEIAHARAVQR